MLPNCIFVHMKVVLGLTHADLCRPLSYFLVAHTSKPLQMPENQVRKLLERLKARGFTVVCGDHTGLIASCHGLPQGLKLARNWEGYFPTSLNISITAKGLILASVFGWYAFSDIRPGEDAEVDKMVPVLKYLERLLKNVTEEGYGMELVRGLRKCFFEHPGAYEGSF